MSKSFNNRILLIVFLVLAGVFVLTEVFLSKRTARTLNTELVDIDTSRITQIMIHPRSADSDEIRFEKKENEWTVSKGEITAEADPMSINRLLNELLNLKTDRLVARSEDSWEEYHVNDSLGSRIIIKEGQKTTLDIFVGRFNYQQPQGGYGRYAQNYGTGYTYVRLKQDDEIYSVEGFLSMSVNQPFEQWRNNLFLKINKNQVSGMVFDYPVDSGFVIRKTDTLWLLDGVKADSARMAGFLSGITGKRGSEFWNGPVPQKSPEYTIGIEGRNMEPVLIEAYEQGNDNFILHSSQNPESFFISGRNGIFEDLFKSRSFFFTGLP